MLASAVPDESVVPVAFGVRWDIGAPLPFLIHCEDFSLLLFYLSDGDPSGHQIGILRWTDCLVVQMGLPGEMGLAGHRLWQRGLQDLPYRGGEVLNSTWIASLDDHTATPLRPEYRHFILPFKDSTFECIAGSFQATTDPGAMGDVLRGIFCRP